MNTFKSVLVDDLLYYFKISVSVMIIVIETISLYNMYISIYFMFSKSQTLSTSERLLTAWSLLCLQARTELHIQLESTVASFNLLHCIISTNSFFKIHIIVDMVDSLILFIFIYCYMNFMNRVFSLTVSYWIQSGNRPARLHVPVIYNEKNSFPYSISIFLTQVLDSGMLLICNKSWEYEILSAGLS